ncbi:heterokaryon incompatibility protein-domain-containing protein [Hypoxylon sp. FL0543]|nr:heterokaryon incompatibility protein-domain-containing protein [Hypoxylon sp. FL0543]
MTVYTNSPLLRGQAHIRLLRILPRQPADDIRCTLDTLSLDGTTRYQALSYEWGPKFSSKTIHIMGQPMSIRLNLWNFLSRLKSRGYHDYLWCDAICIDQTNDDERNHQVQLMAQIYRKAHSVLVWLGEDREDSNATLRTIRLVSTCADRESRSAHLAERQVVWQGLRQLSRRRYWTRIWIVQEITVARDAQLFCGEEAVPWTAFATACKFRPEEVIPWRSELWAPFPEAENEKETIRRDAAREIRHSNMYGLVRSQKRWPQHVECFEDLYTRYSEFGCEDSRDRFFALFGIAKEVVLQRGFSVDYRKDNMETFVSLVGWAAGGAIKIISGRQFIRIAAEVMGFDWSDYPTEFGVDSKPKWSYLFFSWACQPSDISLRCYDCRASFNMPELPSKYGQTYFDQREMIKEFVDARPPLDDAESPTESRFTVFYVTTSSVYLRCKPSGHNSWTVVDRLHNVCWVSSIFTGLTIVAEKPGNYFIKLQNAAQFIEIFLAYAPRFVRRINIDTDSARWPIRVTQIADRGLAEMLKSVEIQSSLALAAREEEEYDSDIEEAPDGSEPPAKPRVLITSVEKSGRQRAGATRVPSRGEEILDPLQKRSEAGLEVSTFPMLGGFLEAEP